jgi:hypothetical protein
MTTDLGPKFSDFKGRLLGIEKRDFSWAERRWWH